MFAQVSEDVASDYDRFKEVLLTSYGLVSERYRERFRTIQIETDASYSDFAFLLASAFKRWIESVNVTTFDQLVEIVMIEQFVSNLPNEVRLWLLDHTPTTLNQAARFTDEFVAIHNPNSTKFKSVLAKISLAFTTNETGVNYAGINLKSMVSQIVIIPNTQINIPSLRYVVGNVDVLDTSEKMA